MDEGGEEQRQAGNEGPKEQSAAPSPKEINDAAVARSSVWSSIGSASHDSLMTSPQPQVFAP